MQHLGKMFHSFGNNSRISLHVAITCMKGDGPLPRLRGLSFVVVVCLVMGNGVTYSVLDTNVLLSLFLGGYFDPCTNGFGA